MTRATPTDLAHATHIDRGTGVLEPITHRGDRSVHVMPHFGIHPVRVPYTAINEWATLETVEEGQP